MPVLDDVEQVSLGYELVGDSGRYEFDVGHRGDMEVRKGGERLLFYGIGWFEVCEGFIDLGDIVIR